MAKVSYEQARADHEYLWNTYGPASDMTGSYVDQEDLSRLLRSPTKATARDCYCSQIEYWFSVGPDNGGEPTEIPTDDPELEEIADRHSVPFRAAKGDV